MIENKRKSFHSIYVVFFKLSIVFVIRREYNVFKFLIELPDIRMKRLKYGG